MAELAVVAEFAKLAPELAKMHRDNFDFIEGKVEKYMDLVMVKHEISPGVPGMYGTRYAILVGKKFVNIDEDGWNAPSDKMGTIFGGEASGTGLIVVGGFGGSATEAGHWNEYRLNYTAAGKLQVGSDKHPTGWYYEDATGITWVHSSVSGKNFPVDRQHVCTDNPILASPSVWFDVDTWTQDEPVQKFKQYLKDTAERVAAQIDGLIADAD